MKHKFLTKNTKITINEVKPNGLKTAEKVYDEDGKINKKSLKDFSKKLSDYYNFDEDEFIEPKVDRTQDETEPWDVYDTEALGAGKMYGLKYDNEDTDVYDSFEERNDKLNDTSDYDDLFGTHDGFGETKDKNNTYERLKDSSKKYKEYKYDLPTEYQKTPRVRVTKGVNENKMKRLNFKTEFKSDADMVGLIPENYKKDGHTFLMSDGNQLYKVRWDTALNEGSILGYKNKSMIVESRNKMKKLYNYKYSDSMGKTNDYITEGDAMRKMMDMVKGKSSLNEQEQEVTEKEGKKDAPIVYSTTIGGQKVDFVQPAYELNGKRHIKGDGVPRVNKFIIGRNGPKDVNAFIKWTNSISPKRGEESFGMAYKKFLEAVNQYPDIELKNKIHFDKYLTKTSDGSGNRYWKNAFYETGQNISYDIDGWEVELIKPYVAYSSATQKPIVDSMGYPAIKLQKINFTSPKGNQYIWQSDFPVLPKQFSSKLKQVKNAAGKVYNIAAIAPDMVGKLSDKIKEG